MSEVEFEFQKDCKEKKMTGRSAFNAGKKQGCSLPSDTMSRKELKGMNGAIISINLNQPMSWTKFKSLPRDLQETYINGLHEKYGCTYSDISTMFDLSRTGFPHYVKTYGLKVFKSAKGSKTSDVKGWNKFLGKPEGAIGAIPESDLSTSEPLKSDPELERVMDEINSNVDENFSRPSATFTACSYDFEGLDGISDIVKLIQKMPWKGNVKVHIEVSCGG